MLKYVLLSLSIFASITTAQAQQRVWPMVGQWVVAMTSADPNPVCVALAPNQKGDGYTFIAGFAFSRDTTHFWVQLDGNNLPAMPPRMDILADGKLLFSGATEQEGVASPTRLVYRINLPGDSLSRLIAPKLAHAVTLGMRSDDGTMKVPVGGFEGVYGELAECAKALLNS